MNIFLYSSRQIGRELYFRAYLSAASSYSEDFATPTIQNYCPKQIRKLRKKK